ncbi:MAG: transcriptional regulator [Coriobacteriales bacterium]|jgi:predicted DNA-binding transcriptional regulator YafY
MARPNETLRLEKALEIIPRLQEGCLSFGEIAEMMGRPLDDAVTVMRDLSACEVDGEPLGFHFIEAAQARAALQRAKGPAAQALEKLAEHGGIIVSGDFGPLSPEASLKPAEVQALLAALDRMHVGDESPLREKIRARAARSAPVDAIAGEELLAYITAADSSATMSELALLCDQHRLADIDYNGRQRTVAPLELYRESNGEAYLWAHDIEDGRGKTFRVDRIAHVEPLAGHASAEMLASPAHPPLLTDNVESALLEMPADELVDERVWTGAEVVAERDGVKQVRIPLQQRHGWMARQIAARFGRVRVIEPADLADEVRACARQLLEEL